MTNLYEVSSALGMFPPILVRADDYANAVRIARDVLYEHDRTVWESCSLFKVQLLTEPNDFRPGHVYAGGRARLFNEKEAAT